MGCESNVTYGGVHICGRADAQKPLVPLNRLPLLWLSMSGMLVTGISRPQSARGTGITRPQSARETGRCAEDASSGSLLAQQRPQSARWSLEASPRAHLLIKLADSRPLPARDPMAATEFGVAALKKASKVSCRPPGGEAVPSPSRSRYRPIAVGAADASARPEDSPWWMHGAPRASAVSPEVPPATTAFNVDDKHFARPLASAPIPPDTRAIARPERWVSQSAAETLAAQRPSALEASRAAAARSLKAQQTEQESAYNVLLDGLSDVLSPHLAAIDESLASGTPTSAACDACLATLKEVAPLLGTLQPTMLRIAAALEGCARESLRAPASAPSPSDGRTSGAVPPPPAQVKSNRVASSQTAAAHYFQIVAEQQRAEKELRGELDGLHISLERQRRAVREGEGEGEGWG